MVVIEPNELRKTAEEFKTASQEQSAVLKRLDDASTELKGKWEGVAQQTFYKEYEVLHRYLEAFSKLMSDISNEMNNMADSFEEADR